MERERYEVALIPKEATRRENGIKTDTKAGTPRNRTNRTPFPEFPAERITFKGRGVERKKKKKI